MFKKKIEFCFTSYKIIDSTGKILGSRISTKNIEYKDLIKSCDIGLSTVMLKKKILKKNKLSFPKLKTKEDYVLCLNISKKIGTLYFLKDQLTYWRKLDNSLSSNTMQKLKDGFKVYNIHLKFNIFRSILNLLNLSLNYLIKKMVNLLITLIFSFLLIYICNKNQYLLSLDHLISSLPSKKVFHF